MDCSPWGRKELDTTEQLLLSLFHSKFTFWKACNLILLFIRLFGCIGSLLPHAGSFIIASGLSCGMWGLINNPPPGTEPVSLALEDGCLPTGSPGKA